MANHAVTSPIVAFAGVLAGHFDCTHLLWCSRQLASRSDVADIKKTGLIAVQVEPGPQDAPQVTPALLRKSVVLLHDAADGDRWLESLDGLRSWMDHAPLAVLAAPASRWTPDSLADRLREAGLRVDFCGLASAQSGGPRDRVLAVIANNASPRLEPAPDDFRVVAIMRAYNEADIIEQSVRHAVAQGLEVYIIDNWSDDGTYEIAGALQGPGVIGVERYPPDGRAEIFDHKRLLQRIETVSSTLDASWCIHYDMDELRESPWPDVTLRDAIYHADQSGYNSINHLTVNFYPSDMAYAPGKNVTDHLRQYTLTGTSASLLQIKAWKHLGKKIQLVSTGGHRVQFLGQRVYPYRFLIRHYPLRTAVQAFSKIRQRRYHVPKLARLLGWHTQYDRYDLTDAQLFENLCEWARKELTEFDPATFYQTYLIERLSGVGYDVPHQRLLSHIPPPLKPPLRKIRYLLRRLI